MNSDKFLYTIGGPTASGKTSLAIELAQKLDSVIISADSRQFYKEMTIGTAKPNMEELATVKHYFIDNLSIHDNYNAGIYEQEVLSLLQTLFQQHDTVIMVGGSGLFLKAVLEGFDSFPKIEPAIKLNVTDIFEKGGVQALQQLVSKADPFYFNSMDTQNPRRLQRAAEIILQTGRTLSDFRTGNVKAREFKIIKHVIVKERSILYKDIDNRVLQMVENGLKSEALSLFPFKDLKPLQTVGYQEWFSFFENEISETKAIELIQQHSRNYAKRQITWFKNDGGWLPNPQF